MSDEGASGAADPAMVDRAAGGIVRHGGRVLVVHRPRYDDWSLPKGHLDRGETWEQAALREVAEETGVPSVVIGPAAPVAYLLSDGTPKLVMFFPMAPAHEPGTEPPATRDEREVDRVEWIDDSEAADRLSYPSERRVFRQLAGLPWE